MKLKTVIFIVLLIIQVISISNGMGNEIHENKLDNTEIIPNLSEKDFHELLKSFNISKITNNKFAYNITNSRHYTQIQLLQNDRILGFFLDKLRDYFSETGFDILKLEEFVKALCNTLFICKIPVIGNISGLIIDGAGILLEAQCYRDYAANMPAKGGLHLTGFTIPKLI